MDAHQGCEFGGQERGGRAGSLDTAVQGLAINAVAKTTINTGRSLVNLEIRFVTERLASLLEFQFMRQ